MGKVVHEKWYRSIGDATNHMFHFKILVSALSLNQNYDS